MKSISA